MFDVQFNAPLWSDAVEETALVETGLGQAADEIPNSQTPVPELSLQFCAPLEIHDVGIAEHLSV